jgi:hypothetical protein
MIDRRMVWAIVAMLVGVASAAKECFKFTGALSSQLELPAGSYVALTWTTTATVKTKFLLFILFLFMLTFKFWKIQRAFRTVSRILQ